MTGWHLKLEPREWQKIALERWREERRGIVRVVTGGGKTVFAQLCLQDFIGDYPAGQALIVVPTVSLQDQWYIALQDELGVQPEQIGLLSGDERPTCDEPIIIAVINTARKFTKQFSEGRSVFLIVDECHRAGSEANAHALDGEFAATLGLSATPEREYDAGFDLIVKPRLGPIIYDYSYSDASRDGIIAPFALINVQVEMLADEEERYSKLNRRIAIALRKSGGEGDDYLKQLLQKRAAVSATATMRIPVSVKLVEMNRGERSVVFHERTDAADKILELLVARGHRATIYHAGIGAAIRRDNLRLFRKGVFDVLVCCRALDEGINVPEASVAVVASSTASNRQRIQRLGRILRRAPGKDSARVYTLFATKEERARLSKEEEKMEGVASVTWQAGKVKADA